MINKIPLLGWILSALASISVSVPFWFCWSHWGLGEKYFSFLPQIYHYIPFWNCVGLFILASIIKGLFPVLVSSSSESQGGSNITETKTIERRFL